jgi:hypothetical protein
VVYATERPLRLTSVYDNIDVGMLRNRFRVVLQKVCQLPVDYEILVAVIFGDCETELTVRAW